MIVLIVIVIVIIKSPMMSSQMPQMTRQCGHSDPRTLPESSMGPPRARPGHPMAQREGPGGGVDPNVVGLAPPSELPPGLLGIPFCHLGSAPESALLLRPLLGALSFGTGLAEVLRSM